MKRPILAAVPLLALVLGAARPLPEAGGAKPAAGYKLMESKPAKAPQWKSKPYEKGGLIFSSGSSLRLADKELAKLEAIKDAAAKAAQYLESKGLGPAQNIQKGVENAALNESTLASYKLGNVKIENLIQERWEAPDGKEAWSVRLLLSIRKSAAVKP